MFAVHEVREGAPMQERRPFCSYLFVVARMPEIWMESERLWSYSEAGSTGCFWAVFEFIVLKQRVM